MPSLGSYNQVVVINTTEAAVATSDAVLEAHSFTIQPDDFKGSALPKISAWKSGGLGAITVTLWERVNNNWIQVFKDGAAFELSATVPQEAIASYGTYALAKASATTGVEASVTKIK